MYKIFLCLLISVAAFASNVVEENEFFAVEKKAEIENFVNQNLENYAITDADNVNNCYFKLLICKRYFFEKKSEAAKDFAIKNAVKAYELFPGSVEIKVQYAILKSYKKDYFDPFFITKLLAPHVQEVARIPGLAGALAFEFSVMKLNIKPGDKNNYMQIFRQDAYRYLNCDTDEQLVKNIELLITYWDALNNPIYARDSEKIIKARKELSYSNRTKAVLLWENLIRELSLENRTVLEHEITKKVLKERSESDREFHRARTEENEPFREEQLKQFINSLTKLESLPNSLAKIEELFKKAGFVKKELKGYRNIPNYERLKSIYKESEEAEILNIAFKSYILGDYTESLHAINCIDNYGKDIRLLSIKVYCLKKLNRSKVEILQEVDKILVLEPENVEAKVLKIYLEH
ncbi:MAG: hypothetical protein ACRC37_05215 [Lentisphaeria bacterium]